MDISIGNTMRCQLSYKTLGKEVRIKFVLTIRTTKILQHDDKVMIR